MCVHACAHFFTNFSYFTQGLPGQKGSKGEPVLVQGSFKGMKVRAFKAES